MDFQKLNQNNSQRKVGLMVLLVIVIIAILGIVLIFTVGSKKNAKESVSPTFSATPTATAGTKASSFTLVSCLSSMTDTPVMPKGWTNSIYSGPLLTKSAVYPNQANNVRTFSYKGITDKTEKNSMYSFTAKTGKDKNGVTLYMTGDTAAIEVCNSENKTISYQSMLTAHHTPSGQNATANIYYLHGGSYLAGPGTYRIDAYLKIGSGKWLLINRMTGITVTP